MTVVVLVGIATTHQSWIEINGLRVIAIAYLMISLVGLAWHTGSLAMLTNDNKMGKFQHGMVRTLCFRVMASAMYVGLAFITLFSDAFPIFGLIVFTVTQAIWLVNTWLDLKIHYSNNNNYH